MTIITEAHLLIQPAIEVQRMVGTLWDASFGKSTPTDEAKLDGNHTYQKSITYRLLMTS